MPDTLYLGVDWGTHSSKWVWARDSREEFKILRSEVHLEEDRLFLSTDPPRHGSVFMGGLKAQLIKNPNSPFWGGLQRRIRLSLGELVAFSLWYLTSEAYEAASRTIRRKPQHLQIRFSLPNWIDIEEGAIGRATYEQAARVACHIFTMKRDGWSREPRPSRENWQAQVARALGVLEISDDAAIDQAPQGFRSMLKREWEVDGNSRFRFVAESSAAGLTGLTRSGGEDQRGVLKILVVDVGAGSTDIGYLLKTDQALCQLPPANTCQVAGEDLSRRILEIYRSKGRRISFDEAELLKIGGRETDWLKHPTVKDWIQRIAEHVREYVTVLTDKRWLPYEPGLAVLVTGGSGVVSGLNKGILQAATDGLREQKISVPTIRATKLLTLALAGPAARDVNRLAVALGASSDELPRLNYFEKLDPPMPRTTVKPPRNWTGLGGKRR